MGLRGPGRTPAPGQSVLLSVRPQSIGLSREPGSDALSVPARIVEGAYLGEHWDYLVAPDGAGEAKLRVTTLPNQRHQPGERVWLRFDPEQLVPID